MVKNMPANAGDSRVVGLTPGSGRSPGEGNDKALQYSSLENPMDREAWWATVRGVTESLTLCYALGFSASAPPGSPSLSLFPAPGGGGPLGAGGWGGVL